MKTSHIVFALVSCWILMQVWSFGASMSIGGPRNIDTGLRRLDVFVQWQIFAFCLAVISAGFVWIAKNAQTKLRIIGSIPALLTLILAGGIFIFVMFGTVEPPQANVNTAPVTQ